MEEAILEIIKEESYNSFQSKELTAKKITSMVMKFIFWKDNKGYLAKADLCAMTLDGLFEHWLTIKDK